MILDAYQDLFSLMEAVCEETVTEEQFHLLQKWLKEDAGARKIFVEYMVFNADLRKTLSPFGEAPLPVGDQETPSERSSAVDEEKRERVRQSAQRQLQAFLDEQEQLKGMQQAAHHRSPSRAIDLKTLGRKVDVTITFCLRNTVRAAIATAAVLILLMTIGYLRTHRVLATLTDTIHVRWDSPPDGNELRQGMMHLWQGVAKFRLVKGAEVVVQAPCEFEVLSENHLRVLDGSVCVQVPPEASGFTLETSESKLIDYGTEFGVRARQAFPYEVHVFKGEVLLAHRGIPKPEPSYTLQGGDAAVADTTGHIQLQALSERPRHFIRQIPDQDDWENPLPLSLVDFILGNGTLPGQRGLQAIDVTNGMLTSIRYEHIAGTRQFHSVQRRYVDGVFVPDRDQGTNVLSTEGHTWTQCPDTDGSTYLGIIAAAGADLFLNFTPEIEGHRIGTGGQAVLYVHANAGITFDLKAIQEDLPLARITHFRSQYGTLRNNEDFLGFTPDASFWVLLDGRICYRRDRMPYDVLEPIEIPITIEDRFLSLIVTDGGNSHRRDHGVFIEPQLILAGHIPGQTEPDK